jgi:hypothetical protein
VKTADISWNKKREYLKYKIKELATNRTRTLETL